MILFLILNLLNYCLLIIPEKIEIPSLSDEDNENFQNCPCDLTYNTCDRNCECDERCNNIDGSNDNYDDYNEYKIPGNHVFEKKYQKLLPMCSDLDKSPITDLYSPLTIGYQILKKGLCLFNKDAVKYDDDLHYDESIDEIIKKLEFDNDSDDSDSLNNEKLKEINDDSSSFDIYDNLNINFPIMLPDGSCLKNNIKFLQDKKVICYEKIEELQKETTNLKSKFINYYKEYLIENNTYLVVNPTITNNEIIKKILFEFFVNNNENTKIHKLMKKKEISLIYDKKPNNNDSYIEVIYEVKFISNDSYYKTRSGNPGYIKGKPILTNLLANRVFSGVDSNGSCIVKKTYNSNSSPKFIYYEDDIIENTFTFEDNIIYGCYDSDTNNDELAIYENIYRNTNYKGFYFYSKKGNSYLRYSNDFQINYTYSEKDSKSHILSIDILYEAIGTKNNTQNQLLFVKDYDFGKLKNPKRNPKYIKVNAFKVQSELEWWYAPGWKITFPNNIMYPFRIGTTSYEEK